MFLPSYHLPQASCCCKVCVTIQALNCLECSAFSGHFKPPENHALCSLSMRLDAPSSAFPSHSSPPDCIVPVPRLPVTLRTLVQRRNEERGPTLPGLSPSAVSLCYWLSPKLVAFAKRVAWESRPLGYSSISIWMTLMSASFLIILLSTKKIKKINRQQTSIFLNITNIILF